MGDAGHHSVGLCPKPRRWSWFGGCPRVEARRVSPTTDENSIYMYTLKYIMERGEEWRVGEPLAAVKAMTGVLHPWNPHVNIKPGTISTTVWDDLIG